MRKKKEEMELERKQIFSDKNVYNFCRFPITLMQLFARAAAITDDEKKITYELLDARQRG